MSNKVRQNLGISHGTYIDISLPKRGPGVGNFCLVIISDHPPPPLFSSLSKKDDLIRNLFGVNDL